MAEKTISLMAIYLMGIIRVIVSRLSSMGNRKKKKEVDHITFPLPQLQ